VDQFLTGGSNDACSPLVEPGAQLLDVAAKHRGPVAPSSVPAEGTREGWRLGLRLLEAQGHAAVGSTYGFQGCAQGDPALVNHRDVIGNPLDLPQQVRREQHGAALVGDGA
jgi:hypothetical protein